MNEALSSHPSRVKYLNHRLSNRQYEPHVSFPKCKHEINQRVTSRAQYRGAFTLARFLVTTRVKHARGNACFSAR
jgi:uncharacterized protein YfaT (DUF1175 family)